MTAILIEN